MEKIMKTMRETAKNALVNKEVAKILGWKKGDLWSDSYPTSIVHSGEAKDLVWDSFCVNNLSKFLIKEQKKSPEKVGVFLKGCDTTSLNQLIKDNRVDKEKVVIFGVPCNGMLDPEKIKELTSHKRVLEVKTTGENVYIKTRKQEFNIPARELEYDKCFTCQNPNPVVYDQLIGEEVDKEIVDSEVVFKGVEEIEAMSPDEKYEFWMNEFEKCIRCNACRDICPACNCEKCTFSNTEQEEAGSSKNKSEDSFFHMVRAYHVAGRCVDCGECARVCPQGIQLDKLNHKIIKDIKENYGEYKAGQDTTSDATLVSYKLEDKESFSTKGGK